MVVDVLTGLVLVLIFIIVFLSLRVKNLKKALESLIFDKKSLSVKHGKMAEQFFPFMKDYPYDVQEFRFLGTPIDGVQFEKDKIVFVEFKTGDSRLSPRQKEIKSLVKKKRVMFEEIRI